MLQRLHRDRLNVNVPVFLSAQQTAVGRLADLSLGGFSLVGTGSPPIEDMLHLDLQLPWAVQGVSRIHLTAEQRWTHLGNGGRWRAGYRLVSCPDEELVALNHFTSGNSTRMRGAN